MNECINIDGTHRMVGGLGGGKWIQYGKSSLQKISSRAHSVISINARAHTQSLHHILNCLNFSFVKIIIAFKNYKNDAYYIRTMNLLKNNNVIRNTCF